LFYALFFFFFFQAEDGIRDFHVTGVQTCALPIFAGRQASPPQARARSEASGRDARGAHAQRRRWQRQPAFARDRRRAGEGHGRRSEERRVGKEGRSGRATEQEREKEEGSEDARAL